MTQALESRHSLRIRPLAFLRSLVSNWRKRRRLYDLQHLDDHMLNDIGISRSDVTATLSQPLSVDPVRDLARRARRRRNRIPQATTRWLNDRAFDHPRITGQQ
jgi:uncharacterized protein YjiS (DUF1127 family)